MIDFIERLYRNPPPGSMCYVKGVWTQCLTGDPRYAVTTFLLVMLALVVAFVIWLVFGLFTGRF